ncbi:MAG: phage holin family protein [Actinomycetota bacterium]
MKVGDPGRTHSERPEGFSDSFSDSIAGLSGNVQSAGQLLSGIAQDVSKLVRLEIELAKQEIVELAKEKAVAAGLAALGVVLGLMLIPFLLLTLFEILDLFMPRWVAALLMSLVVAGGAGGVLILARNKFGGTVKPERTVRSIKESLEWAKRLKR